MKNGIRERNIKLLLETVTYTATTKTVICITTIEIVMCIIHHRKYYLHDCNRHSRTCIVSIQIVTHIFAAETFTCINVAETSNCIIATETVTCIIARKRSTNITVAENTTNIIAIEPQKLHNCNRHWHLHNCYRKCQLHSCNRSCIVAVVLSMNCTVYSLFQFSYLHAFYKLNNITTKLSLKVKSYFQS